MRRQGGLIKSGGECKCFYQGDLFDLGRECFGGSNINYRSKSLCDSITPSKLVQNAECTVATMYDATTVIYDRKLFINVAPVFGWFV